MPGRPYVVLSCAISLDGYLDDATPHRLILSNAADLDRVDAVRAGCDAIMVGANTVRRDDPRLLIRSARRRADRVARGLPANPMKVTVTRGGELPGTARFFTAGPAARLVYCPESRRAAVAAQLAAADPAEIVGLPDPIGLRDVLADLAGRGVRRLMVEGGSGILTGFLTGALADELQLVIAPFLVGDPAAPRFVGPGRFPFDQDRRLSLIETVQMGDCMLLRYRLPPAGEHDG